MLPTGLARERTPLTRSLCFSKEGSGTRERNAFSFSMRTWEEMGRVMPVCTSRCLGVFVTTLSGVHSKVSQNLSV